MVTLEDLYREVQNGFKFRAALGEQKNLTVEIPAFDLYLLKEVGKAFGLDDRPRVRVSWDELVSLYGAPRDIDFFSRDLFCAFVRTQNWLRSIGDYVTDRFEEEVCPAFCLMWEYLYDRFGENTMAVVGELENDEAAQFYDEEFCDD